MYGLYCNLGYFTKHNYNGIHYFVFKIIDFTKTKILLFLYTNRTRSLIFGIYTYYIIAQYYCSSYYAILYIIQIIHSIYIVKIVIIRKLLPNRQSNKGVYVSKAL